jgi:osmotically-inducible protein OsmY
MPSAGERRDQTIARHALTEIRRYLPISWESINVVVRHGWLTLGGQAEWQYQRQAAESAARRIRGLKGVSNVIELTPPTPIVEIEQKVKAALPLNADVAANRSVGANPCEISPGRMLRSWIELVELKRLG